MEFYRSNSATGAGRFNGFLKSVILRVSDARDLGDINRFAFYDHMKVYTAAPPDVLRVDEKHAREYSVLNVCAVVITTTTKLMAFICRPTIGATLRRGQAYRWFYGQKPELLAENNPA
jgi:hypothetical protein